MQCTRTRLTSATRQSARVGFTTSRDEKSENGEATERRDNKFGAATPSRRPGIKRPGARDGERSFGRHPTATRSRPADLRGQGPGMVNVLLAASPATRSRPQAIKGQEPGWWTFSFAAIRANAFAPQKAEVVNELLWDGGQKNVHQPWALASLFAS